MNLVIDIGNSLTKTAVFENGRIVFRESYRSFSVSDFISTKVKYPIYGVILSSVAEDSKTEELAVAIMPHAGHFIVLDHETELPVKNSYRTKSSLGLDRLAASVGAGLLFPGSDVLVIDAGTAITFDLTEKGYNFVGGNISPGLRSRYRALNEFTGRLPDVEATEEWPLIGRDTTEAIQAGVQNGILFETDAMIERVREKIPGVKVVLTGGDAPFFDGKLKNRIFVELDITLIGLNRILEYNVTKE